MWKLFINFYYLHYFYLIFYLFIFLFQLIQKSYNGAKFRGLPKPTTFSLSNNIGMQKMKMLLDGKTYELLENVYDANGKQQEIQIDCSDTNRDNPLALTIDMVTGIEILHKNNLFRKGDDIEE